jgi:hypothetical protein
VGAVEGVWAAAEAIANTGTNSRYNQRLCIFTFEARGQGYHGKPAIVLEAWLAFKWGAGKGDVKLLV